MSDERDNFDDPVFDVMLEELLGDSAPPDLATNILAQLNGEPQSSPAKVTIKQRSQRKRTSLLVPTSLALSIAACVLATIAIVLNSNSTTTPNSNGDLIVESPHTPGSEALLANDQPQKSPQKPESPEAPEPFEKPAPMIIADGNNTAPNAIIVPELKPTPAGWQHPLAFVSSTTITPLSQPDILNDINDELTKQWNEQGIKPSEYATHLEWVRRVYLRLIGRVPTTDELTPFFEREVTPENREALVNRLLFSSQYQEEYLQHWSNLWTNTLIGRHGGTGNDNARREGLSQYLYDSLQANKSYNQIVRELIAATGTSHPADDDFNGAVNFLLASVSGEDTTLATARTTSIFLGQKLQCAQCHNHPSSDIAQNQFWEMDAYYSQLDITRIGKSEQRNFRISNRDFRGFETPEGNAGNFFEQPDGVAKLAFPAFLGHAEASGSGAIEDFDRRSRLASLVSNSPLLERTLVNRIWSHFFGYGFTKDVDDMGPHVQISHPELLTSLADQTRANKYNLKMLLKWIALSDPFLRSSIYSPSNDIDSPELGDQPLFSHYYSRQLEPEEVYHSLLAMSGKFRQPETFAQQQLAQRSWLGQFTRQMDTDEGEEVNTFKGDINQSLVLMNGELMKQATSLERGTVLGEIVASDQSTQSKVQQLFMAALSRQPSPDELMQMKQLAATAGVPEQQFLQDIWWALLNSSEFILDH
tara:strand:+ start:661 stop:2766 length:2106 start_codon:yes stop_codon:yes gene_type:complete